jgi:hypothetical protein
MQVRRRRAAKLSSPAASSPSVDLYYDQRNGCGRIDIEFGDEDYTTKKYLKQHKSELFLRGGNNNRKNANSKHKFNIFAIFLLFVIALWCVQPRGDNPQTEYDRDDLVTEADRYRQQSSPQNRLGGIYTNKETIHSNWKTNTHQKNELPSDWETWSFGRFKKEFQCNKYLSRPQKSLYPMEYWQIMRQTYVEQVDSTLVFDDPVPPTLGYSLRVKGNTQPYYAGQSSTKRGRGLFASRNIRKGELVHDGANSDVSFPNANAWRRFLFHLPKKEIACDVTEWTWTQRQAPNGPMQIMTSFNIAVLMNEADTDEDVNAVPMNSLSSSFYATRDIKKGEEILTDYGIYKTDYDAVGLGW